MKLLFIVCSTLTDNLEQKLCMIENAGMKYPGPLSVESAKIHFSRFITWTKGWSHVLHNEAFCNALVLYDKWNQEKNRQMEWQKAE